MIDGWRLQDIVFEKLLKFFPLNPERQVCDQSFNAYEKEDGKLELPTNQKRIETKDMIDESKHAHRSLEPVKQARDAGRNPRY